MELVELVRLSLRRKMGHPKGLGYNKPANTTEPPSNSEFHRIGPSTPTPPIIPYRANLPLSSSKVIRASIN